MYLTNVQKELVKYNIGLIHTVINKHIVFDKFNLDLCYEDLVSVGSEALCKAAYTYKEEKARFSTYAYRVIHNKLIDHCRKTSDYKNSIDRTCCADESFAFNRASASTDKHYEQIDMLMALVFIKSRCSGITLKGIEALELKIKGCTGVEIAEIYDVKPNTVGAWISRASDFLRNSPEFTDAFL